MTTLSKLKAGSVYEFDFAGMQGNHRRAFLAPLGPGDGGSFGIAVYYVSFDGTVTIKVKWETWESMKASWLKAKEGEWAELAEELLAGEVRILD